MSQNHSDYIKYPIDAVVQVYDAISGWRQCRVIKHDWDHVYGHPTFYVVLVGSPDISWITNSKYMRIE